MKLKIGKDILCKNLNKVINKIKKEVPSVEMDWVRDLENDVIDIEIHYKDIISTQGYSYRCFKGTTESEIYGDIYEEIMQIKYKKEEMDNE